MKEVVPPDTAASADSHIESYIKDLTQEIRSNATIDVLDSLNQTKQTSSPSQYTSIVSN